ncbi:hypothetical protein Bca4012_083382 [Brassica carinata]|uniref:Uncharacterized protein n=1 Tax=Brassica carinata TaxID=52824 RepID=A0A8X7VA93_BRACI|nr:hypothetical protein Bca52824_027369 [Brassica carinata]
MATMIGHAAARMVGGSLLGATASTFCCRSIKINMTNHKFLRSSDGAPSSPPYDISLTLSFYTRFKRLMKLGRNPQTQIKSICSAQYLGNNNNSATLRPKVH